MLSVWSLFLCYFFVFGLEGRGGRRGLHIEETSWIARLRFRLRFKLKLMLSAVSIPPSTSWLGNSRGREERRRGRRFEEKGSTSVSIAQAFFFDRMRFRDTRIDPIQNFLT